MIIRNAVEAGRKSENAFVAVDSLGDEYGWCRVEPHMNEQQTPERPLEIKISAGGRDDAQLSLLAAAMARAMVIARERPDVRARVYAEVPPGDDALMERLTELGFADDDALLRMRRRVVGGPITVPLPEGCAPVGDRLDDPTERRFFLERQEKLFHRDDAAAWLDELRGRPGFRRLLLTARSGLAGELICWMEPETREGVVGLVYTVPDWRRRGVASYLMEAARQYFDQCRLPAAYLPKLRFAKDRPLEDSLLEAVADVRWRQAPAVHLAATAGYRRGETLLRLPGIDL
ncbi:MAG: GNAT family N-acetyltransferase [Clostridia bacterium]|nr:GNAT family N-acetyltransferase [Clostridia bacterium]